MMTVIPEIFFIYYVPAFGAALVFLGLLEMSMPLRAFRLWKWWAGNRFFFLHGIMLIVVGFPLTVYHGPLETAVFVVGLFIVFSGPFILLFPEKFKKTFEMAEEEMKERGGERRVVFFEAFMRIAAGLLCVASFLLR